MRSEVTSESGVRVFAGDITRAGFCMRGARTWYAKYGGDWNAFLKDGLPIEWFEAQGDAFCDAVVADVRRRRGLSQ